MHWAYEIFSIYLLRPFFKFLKYFLGLCCKNQCVWCIFYPLFTVRSIHLYHVVPQGSVQLYPLLIPVSLAQNTLWHKSPVLATPAPTFQVHGAKQRLNFCIIIFWLYASFIYTNVNLQLQFFVECKSLKQLKKLSALKLSKLL